MAADLSHEALKVPANENIEGLEEGHGVETHFHSQVAICKGLKSQPNLDTLAAPFNKPYYNLKANHIREDIYYNPKFLKDWQMVPTDTDMVGCPVPKENGIAVEEFLGENWMERSEVKQAQDWPQYVTESDEGPFAKGHWVPQQWSEGTETTLTTQEQRDAYWNTWKTNEDALNTVSWKYAFTNFEAFNHTFQISIPQEEGIKWPTKAEGEGATATDQEKIDTCLGLELGTIEKYTNQWEQVSCEVLTVVASKGIINDATAHFTKNPRYQPAFAGGLYFRLGDAAPEIFVIIAANGTGLAETLYPNKIASTNEDARWCSSNSGFKFSPCGAPNNFYTFTNVANADQFTFNIKVYYSNYQPPLWYQKEQWWKDQVPASTVEAAAKLEENKEILTVDIHMRGEDKVPRSFVHQLWIRSLMNKGVLMEAIVATYYPNTCEAERFAIVFNPDQTSDSSAGSKLGAFFAGLAVGKVVDITGFTVTFQVDPKVVMVPKKIAEANKEEEKASEDRKHAAEDATTFSAVGLVHAGADLADAHHHENKAKEDRAEAEENPGADIQNQEEGQATLDKLEADKDKNETKEDAASGDVKGADEAADDGVKAEAAEAEAESKE